MRRLLAALAVLTTGLGGSALAQEDAPFAPKCGEFLPMITEAWVGAPHRRLHFVPKFCNKVMVNGTIETIPPGIAVYNGGISTDLTSTCVNKVCGQPLRPNMLYRAYVYKDGGALKINFDVTDHKEDPTHGNEVNAEDPAQSFIGLIATDEKGLVCGGMNLCIASWFNRGHTALGHWIGPAFGKPVAEICNTDPLNPNPNLQMVPWASVKVLIFGINSVFREAWGTPNVFATGTVKNTEVGKYVHAAIAIEWGGSTAQFTNGSPGVVTWTRHKSLSPGRAVRFGTDGELPAPIVPGTEYYVHTILDAHTFTVTDAQGGAPLAFTGPQSGKHIFIMPAQQAGPRSGFFQSAADDAGTLHAVATGGGGAEEGWIKATLMLGAPNGGCARVPEGLIYTSPHHS